MIIIDRLWNKYSNGKFGISVQALIYHEEKEDYYSFCKRVGWIKKERWIGYNDLEWSLNSPVGHLPWIQGIKMYPTKKQMRDVNLGSLALNFGNNLFGSTEDTIVSILSQKITD